MKNIKLFRSLNKETRIRSIKGRLVLYFSVLIILASIVLGSIGLYMAERVITEEVEEALGLLAQEGPKLVVSRIETQLRTLETIALIEEMQSMDWQLQQPILKKQLDKTDFLDMAVVDLDGTAYYTDGGTAQLGDREYIQKAFAGESNVSDLILSRVTDETVIMFATPIKRDGEVVGALIGRRDGNALTNIVQDMGYGEHGFAYVINDKGTLIAYQDRDLVLDQYNPFEELEKDESHRTTAHLFNKILSEKTGISHYNYQGQDMYVSFAPIQGTNWYFIITSDADEILHAIPALRQLIMKIVIIILLVCVVITYLLGHSITSPIIKIVEHSEGLASLDITEDMPPILLKKGDEVGVLARSLQNVIENIRDVINEINLSSNRVLATSEELSATTQQSALAIEEVSKTVEEIARSASHQAESTEKGSTKALVMGRAIGKNKEYMKNMNKVTSKVVEAVEEGLMEINNLSKITQEYNQAAEEIRHAILKTEESSNEIGQASNMISSIAEQTNLLALNAAIEAARAGEAGRGFAVVAEEIRKLAEESQSSTKTIHQIVSDLQDNAQNVVKTMERVENISQRQSNSVINNREKYMAIRESMVEAEGALEQLNISQEEMDKVKDEILETLENLSAIAQENSAATEEVTASIEEQNASMEEIANSSQGLVNLAEDLQKIINKFKYE